MESNSDSEKPATSEGGYPWGSPLQNKIARFFSSLQDSKIETTKCDQCGTVQWPPRSICSRCLSLELSWVELPRRGKLETLGKAYVGAAEGEHLPITVGVVHLDGGLRLLSRIVGADFESLAVGQEVELRKADVVDGKPYWEFASTGNAAGQG